MQEIGKKKVKELIRRRFPKLSPDDKLKTVFSKFSKGDFNIIPVVLDGMLIGEVHEIDLLKAIINPDKVQEKDVIEFGFGVDFGYYAKTASDVMTKHEISVSEDVLIEDVCYLMVQEEVYCVSVMEDDQVIGIVTQQDIIDLAIKRGASWNS